MPSSCALPKTPGPDRKRRGSDDHEIPGAITMSSLFDRPFRLLSRSSFSNPYRPAGGDPRASGHQLAVFQKNAFRCASRLQRSDRLLWVLLSRWWPGWRCSLHIVPRPDTVISAMAPPSSSLVLDAEITPASGKTERGRRDSPLDSRDEPSGNPLWGAPRIHGELLKLGIDRSHNRPWLNISAARGSHHPKLGEPS